MSAIGWALLSGGIMLVWSGMTCRNPVLVIKDALTDTPADQRQAGCASTINTTLLNGQAPNSAANPVGGTGDIGRSSPVSAGSGAVMCAGVDKDAGFHGSALVTMVAIQGAESGYNPNAMGDIGLEDSTWGPSVGISQIRSLKHETGTGQWRDANRLTDPAFNARAAFAISLGGTSFAAWSTYTNGKYRSHLNEAKDAASQVGG